MTDTPDSLRPRIERLARVLWPDAVLDSRPYGESYWHASIGTVRHRTTRPDTRAELVALRIVHRKVLLAVRSVALYGVVNRARDAEARSAELVTKYEQRAVRLRAEAAEAEALAVVAAKDREAAATYAATVMASLTAEQRRALDAVDADDAPT